MGSPALNDHELPKGQLAVGRQRSCRPPLDRTGVRSFSHAATNLARGNACKCPFSALQHGQIALALPGRELNPVFVPLFPLQLHVTVKDVRAERLAGELGVGELVDRLA
jgi:hypothetical protein